MTDQPETGPLSIQEAVRALSQDNRVANPEPDNRAPEADQSQEPDDEEQALLDGMAEEGDTPDDSAAERPQEETDQEEPESAYGRFLPDDGKVRLADGTVTTLAELKKTPLLQSDYTQKTMAIAEERKQIEQTRASFRERENQLKQHGELVAALWQEFLGQPPDPALLDPASGQFDFVGHARLKDEFERKSYRAQQLIQQHQALIQRQAMETEQQRLQTRAREADLLYEKKPDLKDPQKYQKFWTDAVRTVAKVGFTPEDLNQIDDHRTYLILDKAIRYDALEERAGQVRAKVNGKPALLSGSARRSPDAVRGQEAKAAMARLNRTGTMQDGVAAMIALEKARNR
jgi:hypothetical protein